MISLWFLNGWIPWMVLVHRAGMELLFKDILVAGNVLRREIHSRSLLVKDSNAEAVLQSQIDIPAEPFKKKISIPDRLCLVSVAGFFFLLLYFFFFSNFLKYLDATQCCDVSGSINHFFCHVVHVTCNGMWHHSYMETYPIIIDSGNCLGQLSWIFVVCLYFFLCLSHCCISWKMWIHCVMFENRAAFY